MVNENYANLASTMNTICGYLDMGLSIGELYEQCKNWYKDVSNSECYPGNAETVKRFIERVKSAFDSVVDPSDEKMNMIMGAVINKYGLENHEQLENKIAEAFNALDAIDKISKIINTSFVGQKMYYDANSVVNFVSELINQISNMQSVKNNANAMFTNFNAILAENAALKAQIAAMQNCGQNA